ncbi:MAG: 1-acyl-sn-glycerol-3-phosphate acyltransferase [Anaerolineae bacterium]|nr:1-acyl-sn-glycerol-3-phosphate acyltransferase [Anaerolineae bacterium]
MLAIYRLVRVGFNVLFQLILTRRFIGQENFPEPPYLLVTNHISALDTPILCTLCPHIIRAFVAEKHKRNPLFAPVMYMTKGIWVKRGEIDRQALRQALELLSREEVLGIAPEGTRSRVTHALLEGKTGAAYLATRANVPIVPVALIGTQCLKPNILRLRRTQVQAVVGKPFRLPENRRARSQQLQEYTELIMHKIAELLPEEYQGVYRESTRSKRTESLNPAQEDTSLLMGYESSN